MRPATLLEPPWREPTLVCLALIGLLAVNLIVAFLPLGIVRPFAITAIAMLQGGLILWVTMEARHQEPVVKLFSVLGFFFVVTMLALTLSDYLTRTPETQLRESTTSLMMGTRPN